MMGYNVSDSLFLVATGLVLGIFLERFMGALFRWLEERRK